MSIQFKIKSIVKIVPTSTAYKVIIKKIITFLISSLLVRPHNIIRGTKDFRNNEGVYLANGFW